MAAISKTTAQNIAKAIRDQRAGGGNTAALVGGLLLDLVDSTAFSGESATYSIILAAGASSATVNTASLQSLLDQVGAAGGGTVVIPPGTYYLYPVGITYSNIHIRGSGRAVTKLVMGPANGQSLNEMFRFGIAASGSTPVPITNCSIGSFEGDGNRAQQINGSDPAGSNAAIVGVATVAGMEVYDLNVHDCDGYGISFFGTDFSGRSDWHVHDCETHHNNYDGLDIKGGATNRPTRIHIEKVYSHDNGPGNIVGRDSVGFDLRGEKITLLACTANNNTQNGIRVRDGSDGCYSADLIGCWADGNTGSGFQVDGVATGVYRIEGGRANANTQWGCRQESGVLTLAGVELSGQLRGYTNFSTAAISYLNDCTIQDNSNYGVRVDPTGSQCTIRGGVIRRNSINGARFACGTVDLTDVTIADNDQGGTNQAGILFANTVLSWNVVGCRITNLAGSTQNWAVDFASGMSPGTLDSYLAGNSAAPYVGTLPAGTRYTGPTRRGLGVFDVTAYGAAPSAAAATNVTAIAAAVAAAVASNGYVYWPEGVYQTNATLSNLHTVRHRGPGAILRGSDTFYLEPKNSQTNRLYVSTSGSAGNDGLSSSEPTTLAAAATALRNYGPTLEGNWRIVGAAGTYSVNSITLDTPSREWVVIQGPSVGGHPNVPTMILDGTGAGNNKHGFITSGTGVQTWFQDILCQNYNNGTQNSAGWVQGYNSKCIFVNCHATNCDFGGIVADSADNCLVQGGIYQNCRSGIILNATRGTIGYSSSGAGTATQIKNCTQNGVYWSRGAQGHVDNCLFDQNPYHLVIESSARAHTLGNDFRRATVAAISANTGGSYYDDVTTTNVYNDGTGNANAKRYDSFAFSGEQQTWLQASRSSQLRYYDDTTRTLTNAAKTQIGADVFNLPANYFVDAATSILFKVWGDVPNAATSIGIDFVNAVPGIKVMDYSAFVGTPTAGGFYYECLVRCSGVASQRTFATAASSANNPRIGNGAATADMTLIQTVRLMGQSASGTITVRRIEMWVTG